MSGKKEQVLGVRIQARERGLSKEKEVWKVPERPDCHGGSRGPRRRCSRSSEVVAQLTLGQVCRTFV